MARESASTMASTRTAKVISALRVMRERIEHDEQRYRGCALGVSCIGPMPDWGHKEIDAEEATRFLGRDVRSLIQVTLGDFGQTEPYWEWRSFVYFDLLKLGKAADSRGLKLAPQQLIAFKTICSGLESIVDMLPDDIRHRYGLVQSETWWKVLFHLAIHHATELLSVTRERWVYLLDQPWKADGGYKPFAQDKISEYAAQLDMHPPVEDIWPGTIWCSLKEDIFTSTMRAIDLLIELVNKVDEEEQQVDPKSFAGVLAEFEKQAEAVVIPEELSGLELTDDRQWDVARPDEFGAHSITKSELDAYAKECDRCHEPLVVRMGSPFSTPPVSQWCEPLSAEAAQQTPHAACDRHQPAAGDPHQGPRESRVPSSLCGWSDRTSRWPWRRPRFHPGRATGPRPPPNADCRARPNPKPGRRTSNERRL